MLLLILKNKDCLDLEQLKNILQVKTVRSVSNNVKSAEKTLLINRNFRKKYFDLEENIEKMQKNKKKYQILVQIYDNIYFML